MSRAVGRLKGGNSAALAFDITKREVEIDDGLIKTSPDVQSNSLDGRRCEYCLTAARFSVEPKNRPICSLPFRKLIAP